MGSYVVPVGGGIYCASAAASALAAAATDVATLTGSASKIVRCTRITVAGLQTTVGVAVVKLVKRSTANSGGTSGAMTAVPLDSAYPAATATALAYTANPTLGNAVGTIHSSRLAIPAAAGASADQRQWSFDGAVVLRGTGEVLAVNLNGATVTGGTIDVTFEWVEY